MLAGLVATVELGKRASEVVLGVSLVPEVVVVRTAQGPHGPTQQWKRVRVPGLAHEPVRLVVARDMGLSTAGLTCTPQQLSSYIYATIVDGSGTASKAIPFSARLLCYNG